MSATNRGAERVRHDTYNTELTDCTKLVNLCLEIPNEARILEPSAGAGHWIRALRAFRPSTHIEAIEIRPGMKRLHIMSGADMSWEGDFTTWKITDPGGIGIATRGLDHFDWVVGNPPYARETGRISSKTGKPIMEECVGDHVRAAMRVLRPGGRLAFLLRMGWYAPKARDELFRDHHPFRITVLRERPSFSGNGRTDAASYGLFEWVKGWRGDTTIRRF